MAINQLLTAASQHLLTTTRRSLISTSRMVRSTVVMSLSLMLLACSSEPPSFQTGPDKEVNEAGLTRIDNSSMDLSYARENVDWSKYHKIMFSEVNVNNNHPEDYRPPSIDPRTDGPNATYELDDDALRKMGEEFLKVAHTVFDEEQPFQIVKQADANTLVVAVEITDIRLAAPVESSRRSYNSIGGTTYTESSGSLVIAAGVKDGGTGEILAQALDRGAAINQWKQNTKVFNWGDMRTIYRNWLTTFKNGLIRASADHQQQ
ncbi:DUF3313 domain-containing protein [Thalassotalea sp. PS06]|uniref:DUF3313 domain-containing protein n=1 Tax=Thalassotalea sp. PS06 TaxID=2594005 RepID=UPI0021B0A3C4|nr:DUF3313 domain-containing protein [Thalassotalea sp. PS06]